MNFNINPRDALQILDNIGAEFLGTPNIPSNRQTHIKILEAVKILADVIDLHYPLEQPNSTPSIPANENQEKSQKTPEEIVAEVRSKGEK